MAGHNKWAQIKHKKAATDAKKSQAFSKLARLLSVESKKSGGKRESPGLRMAIEKAKAANMPSDNIDRAIQKGAGSDAASMEPVTYEAYGPGGVALLIEGLTDSKNRTSAEIKHTLSKHGTALAEPGSAAWAFEKSAEGLSPTTTIDLSDSELEKLGALVDELEAHDDIQNVYTNAS